MSKFDRNKKKGYTEDHEGVEEDISFESEEEIEMEGSFKDKLKDMRTKLRACEAEKAEHLAGWQRAKADLINARREAEEGRIRQAKFATVGLIEELLSVLDSFTMARGNREIWESVDANWRKGMEQVHAQLTSILKAHGLEEIEAVGQPFDPELHDAAGSEPTADEKQNNVVQRVLQDGYRLHERVIRPARVIVGEYKDV